MKMVTFSRFTMVGLLAMAGLALAGCEKEYTPPPSDSIPAPAPDMVPPGAPAGSDTTTSRGETYPLDVCIVSGHKLGGMGEPVVYQHEGVEVRFCCAECIDEFKKEPAKYMAKLAAAKADPHAGHQH